MEDNGNGRVTLAVLGTKLDALSTKLDTICAQRIEDDRRFRTIEEWNTTSRERWRTHETEHTRIEAKSKIGDWVAYIGAAIAAAIGATVK